MKKTTKKGFTLVELVIVIAIIAILAAVLIPTFSGVVKKANESAVLQAARNAYTEIMAEDIADGVQDGKVKDANITLPTIDNVTLTYQFNDSTGAFELFSYADSAKKWTASFNGTIWETTEP